QSNATTTAARSCFVIVDRGPASRRMRRPARVPSWLLRWSCFVAIATDVGRLRRRLARHRLQGIVTGRVCRKIEIGVESVELEDVVVIARAVGRAGPHVDGLPGEVVA